MWNALKAIEHKAGHSCHNVGIVLKVKCNTEKAYCEIALFNFKANSIYSIKLFSNFPLLKKNNIKHKNYY